MRTVVVRFGGILLVVALAVWLYCVLDAITAERDQVRGLPKGAWIAIVLLTFEVGAVAWLVWGRPRGEAPRAPRTPRLGSSGRTAWPAPRPGSPRAGSFDRSRRPAPDDDPEFLARLDREAARDHERLLGSWEADLRRREEELRRQDGEDPDGGEGDSPRP